MLSCKPILHEFYLANLFCRRRNASPNMTQTVKPNMPQNTKRWKKTLFLYPVFSWPTPHPKVCRTETRTEFKTEYDDKWYSSTLQANTISFCRCETKYEYKCETQYETVYDEVCENAAPQALVAMNKVINVTLTNVSPQVQMMMMMMMMTMVMVVMLMIAMMTLQTDIL